MWSTTYRVSQAQARLLKPTCYEERKDEGGHGKGPAITRLTATLSKATLASTP